MQHDTGPEPARPRPFSPQAIAAFLRAQAPVGQLDRVQAALGAFVGLLVSGLLNHWWLGPSASLPALIGPMGASAVLLFALPASPLAQPWSVIGGNVISALIGIACARLIDAPLPAAALASALAIVGMSLCRCLHPPGGAVALTAVVGGPSVLAAGWSFALMPIGAGSVLLLLMAMLFHRVTGRTYPHRIAVAPPNRHGTADTPPLERIGYQEADIDAVLAQYHDLLDVSRDDLTTLFRQIEARAHRRLHGEIRCEQIMSRDVILSHEEEGVGQARDRLLAHHLSAMPVVGAGGEVLGLAGHAQLLAGAGRTVGEVMDRAPCIARTGTPIDELLPQLSNGRHHEAIVIDGVGRLTGIITQTDLLAALWRGHIAEQAASAGRGGK